MTAAPKKRGFASMSLAKRTAISRKGGSSVPAEKRSFSLNQALARSAGAKGGSVSKGGRAKVAP